MSNENAWALVRPPAMCPPCPYSRPKVVTLWRHTPSCVIPKWIHAILQVTPSKGLKITFFKKVSLCSRLCNKLWDPQWSCPVLYVTSLLPHLALFVGSVIYMCSHVDYTDMYWLMLWNVSGPPYPTQSLDLSVHTDSLNFNNQLFAYDHFVHSQ